MKTPEDEAFDEIAKRQGGFRAKRAMAAAKLLEPVAWTTMPEEEDWCFVSGNKDPNGKLDGKWFPLYTTPPQRTWVGLTDDEIKDIIGSWGDTPIKGYTRKLFDQIEAKLKEKNA